MARYVIHNIHQQNTLLGNEQVKSFLTNTLRKYHRESIQDEVEIFCKNIDRIPMEDIGKNSNGKIKLTKKQLEYYQSKTDDANTFIQEFQPHTTKDKLYTTKEIKIIQAKLYQQNENNKIAQALLFKDLAKDIEYSQTTTDTINQHTS